jgi:hypothetical protein
MPRTGRPSKPVEEHKRTGTYRPDRHGSNLAVVPTAEVALVELDPASVMDRILGDGTNWLAVTDTVALSMLREALVERRDVRERAMSGSVEARRELRELDKQIIGQLSVLGFDPAARSRLGLAEVKRASTLDNLRAQQDARRGR